MNITIIGTGYVGLTTGLALASKKNFVTMFDMQKEKIQILKNGESPFYEKGITESIVSLSKFTKYTMDKSIYNIDDVFFVAVPTPEKKDGSSDLKYVKSVIDDLVQNRDSKKRFLLVMKSTVPVGTNKKIQQILEDKNLNGEVASNPEFLSQGTALSDSLSPHRIIIGTQSNWAKEILEKIFISFNSKILNMSLESAELVKYASNTFQAMKISFVNELANISEALNANIGDVTLGMSYDPVIGSQFLRSGIGYGGSCFPKDTKSLYMQAKNNGVKAFITKAIINTNKSQVIKLADLVLKEKGNVGILGLSFKPGTDDTRETPAHYIIEKLNSNGIIPLVFDPQGIDIYQSMFPNDKIEIKNSSKELIKSSNNILLVTEWVEFKNLTENDFIGKKVFDGRRIYPWSYYQIGRGFKK